MAHSQALSPASDETARECIPVVHDIQLHCRCEQIALRGITRQRALIESERLHCSHDQACEPANPQQDCCEMGVVVARERTTKSQPDSDPKCAFVALPRTAMIADSGSNSLSAMSASLVSACAVQVNEKARALDVHSATARSDAASEQCMRLTRIDCTPAECALATPKVNGDQASVKITALCSGQKQLGLNEVFKEPATPSGGQEAVPAALCIKPEASEGIELDNFAVNVNDLADAIAVEQFLPWLGWLHA